MSQENLDFVECKICGFKGMMLNRHLSKHGITAEEYRQKFPEAKVACESVMKKQGESVSQTWQQKPKIEKPKEEHVCPHCGGKFNYLCNFEKHIQKELNQFVMGKEGTDFVVCRICGMRSDNLEPHIRLCHSMTVAVYQQLHGMETTAETMRIKQREANLGKHFKPMSEKRGAVQCDICNEWYQPETAQDHREKCVASHPDRYELNKDYVQCPECKLAFARLGKHLKKDHGWDEDKIAVEVGRGLQLIANKVVDKWKEAVNKTQSFDEINKKREATHLEKHGFANPFSNPEVQVKMVETSQRRYGTHHPMQNEEVFIRQNESAQTGPSELEKFFDEHTCENVVFTGFGGRFIRTKTGVRKYGRLIKDMNPDFMVFPSNVLESALSASRERRKLSSEKHRTKYVVELLGDYYHSEQVIGVDPVEHEKEVVAAYKSAGIECLVLWEKDVMTRWESIRPMVDAWIDKAVRDMNENPIFSRATRSKVDRRKGNLVAPDGSGKVFRSSNQLQRWMVSPLNYWKAGMVEGEDYVVCRECNTRVSKVTEHIRKSHGMMKNAYLDQHPGAPMVILHKDSLIRSAIVEGNS